ncbi:MAG: FG-GAP repeat domain-containing protein, partial [Ktedonobacteraceae bacterium]
ERRMRQPIPRRASTMQATRTTRAQPRTADTEDDERFYLPAHSGSSAMRYRTTQGQQVVQQGGRRYVLHTEPPPNGGRAARPRHRLVLFGAGMMAMVVLFVVLSWVGTAWQAHQLDATYGMPRTFQTDAVVGHNRDSAANPSHFLFENLHGKVIIIEIPAGDLSKTMVYVGPPIVGDNADGVPVTGSFADVNGDGKPDMLVQIENQRFVYLNNGTKFVSSGPLS